MRTIVLGAALATAVTLTACEKAGPKASGALKQEETSLLAHLPGDADFVFGGNFMRLQKTFSSGPFAAMLQQAATLSPGLQEWTDCFAGHTKMQMVGSVEVADMEMRFVMKGLSLADLEGCAKQAGYTATIDPDKKFIAIETPGSLRQKLGYLVLADGALYGKQGMKLMFSDEGVTRAMLEADIARAAKQTLTSNASLLALVEKADRSRSMWIAGSGTGTSVGDKVGDVVGSIDLVDGMHLEVTVNTKDDLAKEVVDGFDQARSAAGMLGPEIADVIKAVELSRDGGTLHVVAKLSAKQLEALMSFSKRSAGF